MEAGAGTGTDGAGDGDETGAGAGAGAIAATVLQASVRQHLRLNLFVTSQLSHFGHYPFLHDLQERVLGTAKVVRHVLVCVNGNYRSIGDTVFAAHGQVTTCFAVADVLEKGALYSFHQHGVSLHKFSEAYLRHWQQ